MTRFHVDKDTLTAAFDSDLPDPAVVMAAVAELDQAKLVQESTTGRLKLSEARTGREYRLPDLNAEAAFLICSGPSAADLDLSVLDRPGYLTMAVNNAASLIRPDYWCCVDEPAKFLPSIFRDPKVTKFIPRAQAGAKISEPGSSATAPLLDSRAANVLVYDRYAGAFHAPRFTSTSKAYWGDQDPPVGEGCRSVMFVALRILLDVGIRRIYLVGCDFAMDESRPYAFEETKKPEGVAYNNRAYGVNAGRFEALRPVLENAGVTIFNCNPGSKLDAFEKIPFTEAVSRESVIDINEHESTLGRYNRS